jgi:hypothetical protein
MVHKEYYEAYFREEHLLTKEGLYFHLHRMYTFIANDMSRGDLEYVE